MYHEILQVVSSLNAAVSNTRLYAADHPQVFRYLERARDQLDVIFQRQSKITFLTVDGDVVVDNHVLTSTTPQLDHFVALLKQSAIERITFTRQVSMEGLTQLLMDLVATNQDVVRSAPGIILGKVRLPSQEELEEQRDHFTPDIKDRLSALEAVRGRSLTDIQELYHQIKSVKPISQNGLSEIVRGFIKGMMHNINPLQMLASLKSSDEYTFTHAINVCILTMAQAEYLGIKGRVLQDIGIAASMHDAGKMFISDDILNKPDKLTDEEWEHMRGHAERGALYILKLEGIPKLAFIAALEHHIHYNGKGYPELGKDWRPNIVSQMIAISDVFDAMRSRRPYKDPKPDDFIVKILRNESGTTFNPKLVNNFLSMIKA